MLSISVVDYIINVLVFDGISVVIHVFPCFFVFNWKDRIENLKSKLETICIYNIVLKSVADARFCQYGDVMGCGLNCRN